MIRYSSFTRLRKTMQYHNFLKPDVQQNDIQLFSSYRTVNKPRLCYKDQYVKIFVGK